MPTPVFPPTLPSIEHVTINSFAQHDLSWRTGASSILVPNVLDFENPQFEGTYTIEVMVTYPSDESYTERLDIVLTDFNEAPTGIEPAGGERLLARIRRGGSDTGDDTGGDSDGDGVSDRIDSHVDSVTGRAAEIGVIVGTISLTGIGLKFSDIIISAAGGNLLLAVLLLAGIGLIMVLSASGIMAEQSYADKYFFFKKQVVFFVLGLFGRKHLSVPGLHDLLESRRHGLLRGRFRRQGTSSGRNL